MDRFLTKEINFNGLKCLSIFNDCIEIIATLECGPFIISYKKKEGKNILFNTEKSILLKTPLNHHYNLFGGHRIWVAPETYKTSYFPDNKKLKVTQSINKVSFTQTNFGQPFQKTLSIQLNNTQVFLSHRITNLQAKKANCACWTLTMLQPHGTAKIPMLHQQSDKAGLQPSQQINIWNYTDLSKGNIQFLKNQIQVKANLKSGHLKIGTPESIGQLSYQFSEQLFTKTFDPNYKATFDRNSKAEIYCCPQYIELEAISVSQELNKNESIQFDEVWNLT